MGTVCTVRQELCENRERAARRLKEAGLWAGCSPVERSAAADLVRQGSVIALGFGGLIGSGKDTVAAGVCDILRHRRWITAGMSDSLREELGACFDIANSGVRTQHKVQKLLSCTRSEARELLGIIAAALDRDAESGPFHRHPEIRSALQYLGTSIRRRQDSDYWTRSLTRKIVGGLAEGSCVSTSGLRYANEISRFRDAFGFAVLIEVPEELRLKRVRRRDGHESSERAESHDSEEFLKSGAAEATFDMCVDNSKGPEDACEEVVAELWNRGYMSNSGPLDRDI